MPSWRDTVKKRPVQLLPSGSISGETIHTEDTTVKKTNSLLKKGVQKFPGKKNQCDHLFLCACFRNSFEAVLTQYWWILFRRNKICTLCVGFKGTGSNLTCAQKCAVVVWKPLFPEARGRLNPYLDLYNWNNLCVPTHSLDRKGETPRKGKQTNWNQ